MLNENLTWNVHVNSLTGTLKKYASSFKFIKNQIPKICKKKRKKKKEEKKKGYLLMFTPGYNMELKSMGMHAVET